jgi:hypothetical protein
MLAEVIARILEKVGGLVPDVAQAVVNIIRALRG